MTYLDGKWKWTVKLGAEKLFEEILINFMHIYGMHKCIYAYMGMNLR